ncbi:MAG: DEAD/DEAH box helicase family protein, partial [Rhodocyclaceae bacterium]|nr:DEAD/DEAH box helicase family protein [Rhodocyclaceae bacterium]
MKLKKIAAATMWLPGLDPSEFSSAAPDHSTDAEIIPFPVAAIVRQAPVLKATWPAIPADVFDSTITPLAKFNANLAAIQLLRDLESADRLPSEGERNTLHCYTGWGGLPQAFNDAQKDPSWAARSVELRGLLSEAEWQSAQESTPNAHYTSLTVIKAMWDAVERLGFKGGRVLEPSAGVGYFMGGMPTHLAQACDVSAIELDDISARILNKLYGDKANVMHGGFESSSLPDGFFDLAISNVPFGNYGVSEHRNVPYSKFLIHDYFFARALDLVRPSGLVAFITSSGTLDKHEEKIRAHLAGKADLVAAIRLPSTAFKAIANTEVTADIIILQKRAADGKSNQMASWLKSSMLPTSSPIHGEPTTYQSHYFHINEYFIKNPANVIGKIHLGGGAYRSQITCLFDGDLSLSLAEQVAALPEGIYQERNAQNTPSLVSVTPGGPEGFYLIDGVLYEKTGSTAQLVDAPQKKTDRIIGMIRIRDAARELINAQPVTENDDLLAAYRLALNMAYDHFVSQFGALSERANRLAFRADPAAPLLLSLENLNAITGKAEKSDIFSRRTVGATRRLDKTDNPREAMLASIAELGCIDETRIAALMGAPASFALATLEADGLVFHDPESLRWEPADAYLSGNIRQKLKAARASGSRYALNASALEAIIPADLTPQEICARIGSTWIPIADYEAFLNTITESSGNVVEFSALVGTWAVKEDYRARYSVSATQTYGTSRINAVELFTMALNQVLPTITDPTFDGKRTVNQLETIAAREKQQAIRDAFSAWLWNDDDRASRLVRLYNDGFNSTVPRSFSGNHLDLPGFTHCVTLHQHQKDAIWRIISSGYNTLLAHVVGAGKTLTAICAGMEQRRLGRANKPLYVTPNHMLAQFTNEFLRAYPSAKLLMATKDDLAGDSRRQFLSRIATGDWDGVLMTQASFERIKMSDDHMAGYIQAELDRIENAIREINGDRGNRIVKELARAKKQWRVKLDALSAKNRKDDMLNFEDLGIDWLFIDEAHAFKNLFRFTKMSRIAGLPNTNSERAFDMFVKTRYVMAKHDQ